MPDSVDRRTFLHTSASCAGYLAALTPGMPGWFRNFSTSRVDSIQVTQAAWGRLERVGDGLWALISTPLDGDRTTLCNGGIIAGRDGVLVVESFASPRGAEWMAQQARELTGHWPSHVVLTHFHGDHANGVEGFAGDTTPVFHATSETRDLVRDTDAQRENTDAVRARLFADVAILDPSSETPIDLGGRTVRVRPRNGHTPSDVTVELDDPSVVWCGDLVWNGMFPNYRDAIPSQLSRAVRALERDRETVYVPGHGALAGAEDFVRYRQVIDDVERAARRAVERGTPAARGAEEYRLPDSLGEWIMFNPRYFEVAFTAWERELSPR